MTVTADDTGEALLARRVDGEAFAWSQADAIAYAHAIGIGSGSADPGERRFLDASNPEIVPTFAAVIARQAGLNPERLGLDPKRLLHRRQGITFQRPLPSAGQATVDARVVAVSDRGEGRGRAIDIRAEVKAPDGGLFAEVESAYVLDASAAGNTSPPRPAPVFEAARRILIPVAPDQALLYSGCGDRNPIHLDPEAARAAGLPGPILHGLCTYGIVCRAILVEGGVAPSDLRGLDLTFASPVFPGDLLAIGLAPSDGGLLIDVRAADRGDTLIGRGQAGVGRN